MRGADIDSMYTEHAAAIYAFLRYRTGDAALSEDLLADVFERAWKARRRFDPSRASAKTWLHAIALNCLRDEMRRREAERRALVRYADDPAHPGDLTEDGAETKDLVARALETLDPQDRELVALRFGGDLRLEDIARLLGTTASAVAGRVHRALAKMRDVLEEPSPGPADPAQSEPADASDDLPWLPMNAGTPSADIPAPARGRTSP